MFKKFFALLLAGVLMASLVACGNFDSDTKTSSNAASNSSDESVAESAENNNEEGTPAAEGKVNKYKRYQLERADNDQIRMELWYRTGSDYVARVTGEIVVPTGSTEYDGMLADCIAFDEKVKAAGLSEEIMQFGYGEVKLDNGYVRCYFAFDELDADNVDSVAMVAEFLGLPASNGYFELAECEEYLQQNDIPLNDEY